MDYWSGAAHIFVGLSGIEGILVFRVFESFGSNARSIPPPSLFDAWRSRDIIGYLWMKENPGILGMNLIRRP